MTKSLSSSSFWFTNFSCNFFVWVLLEGVKNDFLMFPCWLFLVVLLVIKGVIEGGIWYDLLRSGVDSYWVLEVLLYLEFVCYCWQSKCNVLQVNLMNSSVRLWSWFKADYFSSWSSVTYYLSSSIYSIKSLLIVLGCIN